ncbi:DUF2514 domain-containing protein [Aeromonas veronii]|uniref:DUF2514 family protein n=1 Tax=Aeromonas veronii TaxID=654 RepID=UPI00191F0EE5|nr:DUF2514 family protein [Aeromonas veronii]MBL0492929.1 DUF2514 family protein [Aeromonas veronii]MCF5760196.1 DUF2514 domain-containing protein [Aeromonas veronii]
MALFPQSNALHFLVGALVIAALAGGGVALYQSGHSVGEEGERKTWQAKWDKQSAELAEARAQNVQLAREEEQRRQRAIDKVRQDAEQQIARVETDAAAASAVAAGVLEQARRLATRASQCANHSRVTQSGDAARQPAVVLADVLGRADARAGELARAYDRARTAGLACERAYFSLTQSH